MIIFAVVLMVLAAVFALGVAIGSSEGVELEFFTFTTDSSAGGVFLVGIVTGIVFMIGLWLLMGALRRERSRHVERKEMEHRREELEQEKLELEKKLGTGRTTTRTEPQTSPRRPASPPPSDSTDARRDKSRHDRSGDTS